MCIWYWQTVTTVNSGHCRLCCCCIYRRDHHCLYLNRCVAADTRRLFVAFLLVAVTLVASFEYLAVVYLRLRHARPPAALLEWNVVTEVFDAEVVVWPICVLDALAACVLTAIVVHQLVKISGESLVRQQSKLTVKQRLRNVLEFAVGRTTHVDDQPLCHRGQADCVV